MRGNSAKKKFGKTKKSEESGAMLDAFDRIDLQDDKDLQDDQYDDLLRDSANYRKTLAVHDFEQDPKYQGVRVSKKNLYNAPVEEEEDYDESIPSEEVMGEDADDDFINDEDEEDIDEDIQPSKGRTKSKNVLNNINVDGLLKEIDAEDREIISTQKDRTKELKKARAVKNQQGLFDMLIESRIKMQDTLKLANRLPYTELFPILNKIDTTDEIKKSLKELEIEVIDLIDTLDEISYSYHTKVNSDCSLVKRKRLYKSKNHLKQNKIAAKEFIKNYDFDAEQVWKSVAEDFDLQVPVIDTTISSWAQKFNIMTQNSIKGRFANIFQTPIQQTQQAMEDYDRLVKRSQVKDISSKPMFAAGEEATNYDEEIYNDEEFYLMLFREMIQKQAQSEAQNENNEFLLEDTRLYLKNRQLKARPKKDVDRRASKNRKLRFDVHSKLMNFIAPIDNTLVLAGRDQILKNLFGLYDKIDEKVANQSRIKDIGAGLKKKRKKNPEAEENEFEISLL